MRVLVTRPDPDGAAFSALLRARGHAAIACPMMEIAFRDDPVDLGGAGALAFTSANGVRAFAQTSKDRGLPVFAVGPATGDAARAAGFARVSCAKGDVASLAALIAGPGSGISGDVIHVAGSSRAGDLAAALDQLAIPARRAVLYDARPVERISAELAATIINDPPDWAVFFSPRTAKIFTLLSGDAGIAGALNRIKAACLSQAVADALIEGDWGAIALAKDRSTDAVISLIDHPI
jgi:uroporphyrinogen-III synthase